MSIVKQLACSSSKAPVACLPSAFREMVPSAAALMRKSHKLVARNRSGLRMLAKVFATAVLGLLGLIFLHPALQPLAAVIMGGAMVAFNLIGVDCDEGLFFRSTMLNAAVGGAVAAVCGPVELISKVRPALEHAHARAASCFAMLRRRSPRSHLPARLLAESREHFDCLEAHRVLLLQRRCALDAQYAAP